jgi:hypothetical protein
LFKLGEPADALFLYYGNRAALTPSYDLSLVSTELRAAPKVAATLGAVEQLKPGGGWRFGATGTGGPLLWVVLAVVGGTLLVLIVRLLPKPAEPAAGGKDDGQK